MCVCVSHQFEAAVAEDVLIIKNQPGEKKERKENTKLTQFKFFILKHDVKTHSRLKAAVMKSDEACGDLKSGCDQQNISKLRKKRLN